MKLRILISAAVMTVGLGFAASAQAFPVAPVNGVQNPMIVQAGFFCGPGWHLGPHGHHCFPNHPRRWHRWHRW